MNNLLNAALLYQAQGFQVFPLKPKSKEPLTPHGFKDATNCPEKIRAWWTQCPNANIGIATGKMSGLWVVDVDGDYPAEFPQLPKTTTVKTSKGRHYYFRYLEGMSIGCRTKIGEHHVDIRGDGGYIVAPPSVHPDGGCYEFVTE